MAEMLCRVVFASLVVKSLASFALATDIDGQGSGFSMYKAGKLAEVLPYNPTRRLETHRVMQRLGQLSLKPLFRKTVAEIETDTLPGLTRLVLIDNDNDTAADYFVYYCDEGPSGLDAAFFGFFEGGPPAWVVFPVGPAIDDNNEFLFLFTHWVDRNSDGKLDLIIQEGVDMDGSGWPEAGASAWIADNDFDGLIDTAMHRVGSECSQIEVANGAFDLKLFIKPSEDENRIKVGAKFYNAAFFEWAVSGSSPFDKYEIAHDPRLGLFRTCGNLGHCSHQWRDVGRPRTLQY